MFDDLIPKKAGMFDDLVPQKKVDPYEQDVRDGTANSVKFGGEPGIGDLIQNAIPFSDEIIGGMMGATKAVGEIGSDLMQGKMPDGVGDAFQGGYDDTVGDMRARVKIAREKYGILPEIIGGFATAGPGKQIATGIYNAGKEMVKQGAIWGGLSAAGEATGGLQERGAALAKGATVGAVAGKTLHLAGKGAGMLAPHAGRIAKKVGIGRTTDDHVLRGLDNSGMTPEQALTHYNEGQQASHFSNPSGVNPQRSALPESIADFGDGTARLGRMLKTHQGPAAQIADDAMHGRASGQFERVNEHLGRSMQVKSKEFHATADDFSSVQKVAAKNNFSDAYASPVPFDAQDVVSRWQMELASYPNGSPQNRSLQKSLSYMTHFVDDSGKIANLQGFQKAKEAVDDMIGKAVRGGKRQLVRQLTMMKNEFLDLAKSSNPHYEKALNEFSGHAAVKNALQDGRDFIKGDHEITEAAFRAMSQSEQKAFRLGVVREMEKRTGSKQRGHDMTTDFNKPNMERLFDITANSRQGRGSEWTGRGARWRKDHLDELVKRERNFNRTKNIITGGSPTAEKLADDAEFMSNTLAGMVKSKGGVTQAALDYVATNVSHIFEVRAGEAEAIAKVIFETNPKVIRATLRRLSGIMRPSKFTQMRQFVQQQRKAISDKAKYTHGLSTALGRDQGRQQNER